MNEYNHENQAIDKYEQLIAAAITLLPYIPVYKPQLFVSKNGTQSRHAAYHKHTVS